MIRRKRSSRPKKRRGSRRPLRRNTEIKPDWHLVKLDEHQHWRADIKRMAPEIYGVYAYDKNKHVHVAEITPSYELTFIAFDYTESPEVAEDEDLRNTLNELILEGQADQELGTYMHVSTLDKIVEKHPKRDRSIQKYLDAPDPDDSEREQEKALLDQVMEGWNTGSFMF